MSTSDRSREKKTHRDLFDEETLRKIRLTPEEGGLAADPSPGWTGQEAETGAANRLPEELPGETQTRRSLFDEATLRRVRLTPEPTRCGPATAIDNARRFSPWYWPSVSNIEGARSAAAQGVAAALVIAVFSLIGAALLAADVVHFGELEFDPSDAWAPVYGAVAALFISWGIHCMSRVAAVLGLVFYSLDRVAMLAMVGPKYGMSILTLFVLLGLVNGVRGTFAYHQLTLVDHR